jgi:hypothetical protein
LSAGQPRTVCHSSAECTWHHNFYSTSFLHLWSYLTLYCCCCCCCFALLHLAALLHNLFHRSAARAKWAQEAAEVLLGVILNANNSQRSRQAAISGMGLLSQQLDVHVSVWLAPVLAAMSPPLMSRRIIPVRVSAAAVAACWLSGASLGLSFQFDLNVGVACAALCDRCVTERADSHVPSVTS